MNEKAKVINVPNGSGGTLTNENDNPEFYECIAGEVILSARNFNDGTEAERFFRNQRAVATHWYELDISPIVDCASLGASVIADRVRLMEGNEAKKQAFMLQCAMAVPNSTPRVYMFLARYDDASMFMSVRFVIEPKNNDNVMSSPAVLTTMNGHCVAGAMSLAEAELLKEGLDEIEKDMVDTAMTEQTEKLWEASGLDYKNGEAEAFARASLKFQPMYMSMQYLADNFFARYGNDEMREILQDMATMYQTED